MSNRRTMTREIGTAFAVLAIYLLTILAPLHQARASQLRFQELGFATVETGWVLCSPLGQSRDSQIPVSKCPAAGISKHDATLPPPAAILLPPDRTARAIMPPEAEQSLHALEPASPLGARGPPVSV